MGVTGNRLPPGPKGLPIVGVAFELRPDPLAGLQRFAREYGDVARFCVMMQERILLSHPDYVHQVLVTQANKFHKSELTRRITGRMLGNGLLISEGDFWRRQRRLEQPAFHRARIQEYAVPMVELCRAHIDQWRGGEQRDIAQEMTAITLDIAVKTLFGTSLPGEAHQVGEAMIYLMRYSMRRQRLPLQLPENWPTPRNRRANRELEFMDSIIYKIIADRQAEKNSQPYNDLLHLLMSAMDEDGSQMTPQQLHDEAITLFVAGHETTSQMLAWTWYLLAQNPEAEKRLHEELDSVLGDREPQASDFGKLVYLQALMNEVLRLYPPAYIMAREVIEPVEISGYEFTPGTTIVMAQWVSHRDPRFFDDPEVFRPERWLEGLMNKLPSGAYYPFGDGARRCIGQGFALLEAAIVIGMVAQRFQFRLVPGKTVAIEPLVTLRPRHGIHMTLHERAKSSRASTAAKTA
jgi:cytochrome P450